MKILIALIMLAVAAPALARDPAQAAAFRRTHPCPATLKIQRSCPGYVVDHIKPLCAGGADRPSNMQWQEYRASLKKDAQERRLCRALKL